MTEADRDGERGLVEAREAALATIRELDFDFATGKLADPDYQALRARYERRALALLKATDPAAPPAVVLEPDYRNGVAAAVAHPPHRNGTVHHEVDEPARSPRSRGRRTALAAGTVALVFVAGVAAIYLTGQRGQGAAMATDHEMLLARLDSRRRAKLLVQNQARRRGSRGERAR